VFAVGHVGKNCSVLNGWQLFTGEMPFAHIPAHQEMAVVIQVLGGRLPAARHVLPFHIRSAVWAIMEKCWSQNATDRPQIAGVVNMLEFQRVLVAFERRLQLKYPSVDLDLFSNPDQGRFLKTLGYEAAWPNIRSALQRRWSK
jgi:hypothetical protein